MKKPDSANGEGDFHQTNQHNEGKSADFALLILATQAIEQYEKRLALTSAMIWGARLTTSIKAHKDLSALLSFPGLLRFVVLSKSRPQFKLVHRSITVPKTLAVRYGIGPGPVRVRLYIGRKGDEWVGDDGEEESCFTAAWPDLPRHYRVQILQDKEGGWRFWYKPSQRGRKARAAAISLLRGLDNLVEASQFIAEKRKRRA